MSVDKLLPEIRETFSKLPTLPFHIKPLLPLAKFLYNMAAKSPLDDDIAVETVREGGLDIRVYSPKNGKSSAGVVWCFGGGHVAGKAEHVNRNANNIVKATGATVFAPDYRLSPKHPFPADHDDCYVAWQYMVKNADKYGLDTERLAVGGNSAGGGLAAGLAQRVLDAGGPQPKAQILFYPMLDDRTAADFSNDTLDTVVWKNKANRVAWGAYLAPNKPGAVSLPEYSAPSRRGNLAGLAPAWIGYGDIDLFAQEDADYAERLKEAGVECTVDLVKGAPHAFEAICPNADVSQQFVSSAMSFLKSKIG